MSTSTVTYSPEDDKIRLYVGRVPRDEYEALRKAGFVSTPKQDCDFVAVWTPEREDMAKEYLEDGEDIGDEGYSPEERAADRAERFGGYRDNRADSAGMSADRFDAGPSAFGHQNRARAERQAKRHDRNRTYAVSQWNKAEYWQMRTAGVISHALYKSSPHVRRGRVLTIESDLRRCEQGGRWFEHLTLRLEYEKAMLANEGGMVSEADMEPGGWIRPRRRDVQFGRAHTDADGWCQVLRVFKSPATGRVTSVQVMGADPYMNDHTVKPRTIEVSRLGEDAYRPPTDEERAAFATEVKERKAEAKATKGATIPLINPTDEDAEKLQAHWNAKEEARHNAREIKSWGKVADDRQYKPTEVRRMTQEQYSLKSKGAYALYETVEVCEHGYRPKRWEGNMEATNPPVAFKVRRASSGGFGIAAEAVIVITDKPQKPIPLDWEAITAPAELVTA